MERTAAQLKRFGVIIGPYVAVVFFMMAFLPGLRALKAIDELNSVAFYAGCAGLGVSGALVFHLLRTRGRRSADNRP